MNSIIEILYLYFLEKEPARISEKEAELYDKLMNILTKEQLTIFNDFLDLYANRKSDECERCFRIGFTKGARLLIETETVLYP